jgi:O-antigen/teichoic acid export membrane protein
MTRTHRSFWSYFTSTAFSVVTVLVALVATPLLLRWLGEERFGAFRAASDWAGYLGLLELGLGNALLPLLARALGRSDEDGLRATLAAGIRAYAWLALAMLAGGVGLALAIPRLVPVSSASAGDLRQGFCIGLLVILLAPLSPFRLLAEAGQRAYVVNGLLIAQSLLITGLALLLAWWGWGITGQYVAAVTGAALFSSLIAVICIGEMRDGLNLLRSADKPDPALRGELWRLHWPTLVHNLCGRVSLLTDNIIIAALLGPVAVVPYFLTQRLALLVQGQLQGIGNASWAGLADLHVRRQGDAARQRLIDLTSLVAILGVGSLVPILAYNRHFLRLWVPQGAFGGDLLTLLAVVNGFLQALFSLWGWLFCGTGQVARMVPMLLIGTALNLAVSLLGTWLFGLPGPLVGTLVAFLGVYAWLLPLLLRKVFGISLRQLFQALARPLLLGLPYAGCVWWLAGAEAPRGWIALACEMTAAGTIYLVLAWWVVLGRSERAFWRDRVRLVLGLRAAIQESWTRSQGSGVTSQEWEPSFMTADRENKL